MTSPNTPTKDMIIAELTDALKEAMCDIKHLKSMLQGVAAIGYEFMTVVLHNDDNDDNNDDNDNDNNMG
tara:strand:+ start:813 stop:1019 length:207 start_codon:yes stop_codon:yes gene_type:complete